jgi:dolichol-phosphate mannosyltransferase
MPIRATSLIGLAVAAIGGLYALLVVTLRLTTGFVPEGWTSLMVVVLVVGGVQMLMIGSLGEYMWRNLDETRRRPRFIIERVIEQTEQDEEGAPAHVQEPTAVAAAADGRPGDAN